MFRQIIILLRYENAFFEDPFVDLLAVGFGNEPCTQVLLVCCQGQKELLYGSLHGGEFLVALRGIAYYHDLGRLMGLVFVGGFVL